MIDALQFAELKAGGRLPSPSGLALQLIETLRREDASLPEICRLIQQDPALTGRLLKLANSAAYARPRPAAAVTPEVLMLLGLPTVRNLVLAFSLIEGQRAGPAQRFDYAAFWSHALAEACVAQAIGLRLRIAPPAEMFTLGLLADVGRLALASIAPEICDELIEWLGPDADPARLAAEEKARLGYDHGELAAALLADWGLPTLFADAARWHALPETNWPFPAASRAERLTAALALAHRLADAFRLDDEARRNAADALAIRADRLGLDDWLGMADEALAAWREWGGLFAIPAPAMTPFSLLPLQAKSVASRSLRVLVVEDDPTTRRLLEGVLAKAGYDVRAAADGEEGLALARAWLPEIVVTDILMPRLDGIELIRALRACEECRHAYVVVITVLDAADKLVEAFALGADDYVVKPLDARVLLARLLAGARAIRLRQELVERNLALSEALVRAERASLTDPLTGLPNRRYAMRRLAQECVAAERSERPLSVMMIDLDHFKAINDRYGHDVGDAALIQTAQRLQDAIRLSDVLCRIGGEEFLLIAVDTPRQAAARLAERIRLALAGKPLALGQQALSLTLSIGVAEKGADGCANVDQLLKAADAALYRAKAAGRNRVELAP